MMALVSVSSRHHRQTPRRVRHKFKVDECSLYRRVSQPARQIVDWDTVYDTAVRQTAGFDVPSQLRLTHGGPARDRPILHGHLIGVNYLCRFLWPRRKNLPKVLHTLSAA